MATISCLINTVQFGVLNSAGTAWRETCQDGNFDSYWQPQHQQYAAFIKQIITFSSQNYNLLKYFPADFWKKNVMPKWTVCHMMITGVRIKKIREYNE